MQWKPYNHRWPAPFIAAPTRSTCEHAALPCLYTEQCFTDSQGARGFAAALCAKLFAIATLFGLGADVFVTDRQHVSPCPDYCGPDHHPHPLTLILTHSDVAFFGPPPWVSPVFREFSIVGQADAAPLNTGMLYFQHVRPSADHTVQWILAEWLHRVQTSLVYRRV